LILLVKGRPLRGSLLVPCPQVGDRAGPLGVKGLKKLSSLKKLSLSKKKILGGIFTGDK